MMTLQDIPDLAGPICFDLETVADPAAVPFLPKVTADARLKDQAKIDADIAKKKAKQVDGMALNANTARICACGLAAMTEEGKLWSGALLVEPKQPEAVLLNMIWMALACKSHFITFNGSGFDVPMMMRRSMKHNCMPTVQISTGRYDQPPKGNHWDMLQVLGHYGQHSTGGLDCISQVMLGETKAVEGAAESKGVGKFWEAGDLEAIEKRAAQDAALTFKLWQKACNIYFIWKG